MALWAWLDWDAQRCPGCGRPLDECLEGGANQQEFVVGEITCAACRAVEAHDRKHSKVDSIRTGDPDRTRFVHRQLFTRAEAQAVAERQQETTS